MLPFLYRSDSFVLPTYLVLNSLLFSFAVVWAAKKADRLGADRNQILDLGILFMFGAFLGARAFHVLWEMPTMYFQNPQYIPQFWLGGFVFYGGAIGAAIFTFFFFKWKKLSFLWVADFFTPIFSFGYALGRLGCLSAGCCYGRPTQMPWGIVFPEGVEAPAHVHLHPTQLYAFLTEIVIFGIVQRFSRNSKNIGSGKIFGIWLTLHAPARILMESFRDDFRGPTIAGLSVSILLSIGAFGLGLFLLMRRPKASQGM